MSSYLKPQSPLYHKGEDAYFYPLTTEDQVIMDDGSRLSGNNFLSVDKNGSNIGEPNPINADTLGGKSSEYYATTEMVDSITPENIGAVNQSSVVNNFTTTEEGFVADARALKVLNDGICGWTPPMAIATYDFGKLIILKNDMLRLGMIVWHGNNTTSTAGTYKINLPNGYSSAYQCCVPMRGNTSSVIEVTATYINMIIHAGTWSEATMMYVLA